MFFKIITFLGDLYLLLPALAVILFFLWRKKETRKAFFVAGFFLSGVLLGWLLKLAVKRPRPENALVETIGYAFPSGHALHALLFYSLLIFLYKDDITNNLLRYLFISVNILLIMLVGWSRVALRAHYPSDVIGGYVFGLLWLVIWYTVFLLSKRKKLKH